MANEVKETAAAVEVSAKDQLKEVKANLAQAKSDLRKFKVAEKIKDPEAIKDEKVKAQYDELAAKVDALSEEREKLLEAVKATKGSGKGGAKYSYGQVVDPVTKELRDMTDDEKKRWRTKARAQAKKDGLAGPELVPMDPNFLIKPPKKEKPKKEKAKKEGEEPAEGTETPKAPERPKKKAKREKKEDLDD